MKKELKHCDGCGKDLIVSSFYNSRNPLHVSGLCNICKDCLKKQVNINNINTVYEVLKALNLPFMKKYWDKAVESNGDTFGSYMRMANSLVQLKNKTWENSIFDDEKEQMNNSMNIIENKLKEFIITEDMIIKWGSKHEKEDYIQLENFYNAMQDINNIETPQDEDYLRKLSMISLKMDRELEDGHYDEAKKLGDLYSKYMADSKFRAMDKTDADKTGGIRNFCSIYKEVESDGFIPPWEYYRKLKGLSQDIVDKSIMHIENFTLRLNKINMATTPPSDTPKLTDKDTDIFDKQEGEDNGIT